VLAALSGGARAISVLSNFFHGNSTRWLVFSYLQCHVLLKVGGGMGIMVGSVVAAGGWRLLWVAFILDIPV
jgi:hypothetical protein